MEILLPVACSLLTEKTLGGSRSLPRVPLSLQLGPTELSPGANHPAHAAGASKHRDGGKLQDPLWAPEAGQTRVKGLD